jgi:hypothetical protein
MIDGKHEIHKPAVLCVLTLLIVGVVFGSAAYPAAGQDVSLAEADNAALNGASPAVETNAIYLLPILCQSITICPCFRSHHLDEPQLGAWQQRQELERLPGLHILSGAFRAPTYYTIYLEANHPTPQVVIAKNLTSPSFDPETFAENTQYYWKVVATDADGRQVESATWAFRTEAAPNPPDLAAMVDVPGGPFFMGCDRTNPAEGPCSEDWSYNYLDEPVRVVQVDDFKIDKYEVTNQEYWRAWVGACDLPLDPT